MQQINKDVLESSLHSFNLKNICWGFLKMGICYIVSFLLFAIPEVPIESLQEEASGFSCTYSVEGLPKSPTSYQLILNAEYGHLMSFGESRNFMFVFRFPFDVPLHYKISIVKPTTNQPSICCDWKWVG